ncbi:MAG TPA: prepilin-type N-terminal cleavage/methylation domain-containing protein [Verrucomicrobiae bacterium]|nr:prepilin-type N-terminal cleavage/methylation domain-containing protein [Verrucomicrobiae bacterium]
MFPLSLNPLRLRRAGAPGIPRPSAGFTLIEIMVVVAIMALMMAISVPFAYHALHRDAFNQTLRDIEEIFANARAQAILQGSMAEVVIHKDKFELSAPAGGSTENMNVGSMEAGLAASPHSGRSAQLSEQVGIAALRINGVSLMDADEARVRFYPNGTCDELTLVLINLENRESRGINLEVTTGLVSIESNPDKLAREIR